MDGKKAYCSCSECCYDYIVIGAGAAGCVVAARLAEDQNVSVLVLESGHDNTLSPENTTINEYQKALMNVPLFAPILWERYHQNPNIPTCSGLEPSPTHLEYTTVKELDRYYAYPRGTGAGGSTNHHIMVDGRGSATVYNDIAKAVDDPRWSYCNVLPYYKKMETYYPETPCPEIHGYDGWLNIQNTGLENEFTDDFINLVTNLGVPYQEDPNIPSSAAGIFRGQNQVNAATGMRSYAYRDLLQPILDTQNNVKVKFGSLVDKILIKNNKAYGVKVYHKDYLMRVDTTGNKIVPTTGECIAVLPDKTLPAQKRYYARKEVILCAGAISTPQILMLSGIGPKNELRSLGIKVIKNLPVGKNLMDHQEANLIYELDPTKFMWRWQAQLLLPNIDQVPDDIKPIVQKYADPTSLSQVPVPLMWDWFSNPVSGCPSNCYDPDVHVHVAATFFFDFNLTFVRPPGDDLHIVQTAHDTYMPNREDPTSPFGIPGVKSELSASQVNPAAPRVFLDFLTENLIVKETGSVTLASKDPRMSPVIQLGLWKDEEAHERLALMFQQIRAVMDTPEMRKYAINPDNYSTFELYPGTQAKSLEDLKKYIQVWQSFGHHMAGTAKMGARDDCNSVVDSSLRVKGIHNLRVVDISVYPTPHLHAFNPSRGVYLIAEVASDIIKGYI